MNRPRPPRREPRLFAGNAGRVRYESAEPPELRFTVEPKGARPQWFYFLAKPPKEPASNDKLKLVLEHYDTLEGAKDPAECAPLFKVDGQWWTRMAPGKAERSPDGQVSASWTINQPEKNFEVALCYPYAEDDLKKLVNKKDGVWMRETIGLTSGGRHLTRLANSHERHPRFPNGLYIVARERGCDMPAAWVLDGLLQRLAAAKNNPFLTWAIPVADPDAVRSGALYSHPEIRHGWTEFDDGKRQEVAVMQTDIERWRTRCEPVLGLAIGAAPLSETSGIYCELPFDEALHPPIQKWANVIKQKLGPEFAAADFVRPGNRPTHPLTDWMPRTIDVCGLSLRIPWTSAGDTIFSPKKYRDAGRCIADALIEKRK